MQIKNRFSSLNRNEILEEIIHTESDVLIIGGGITGAGIALDAASRNLKVTLIEKSDFACGTSSKSTKLVHGGLRYLEQFEFNLVRKVGRERSILYKNAPHLVIPQKMLLPIFKNGKLTKFTSFIALSIYDFLAGVIKNERKRMLNKKQVLKLNPLFKDQLIKGGAIYYEYSTNDSRLTIETLKRAIEYGALALNYLKVEKFIYKNEKLIGVEVIDVKSNKKSNIYAKNIINATGPWLDNIRNIDDSLNHKRLYLTKGIHISISHKKLPLNQAVYFDTLDKRMIFAIPKNNCTYIGTTDTRYIEDIDIPTVAKSDVEYLIRSVNRIFNIDLEISDINSSWAGLRPLIYKGEKNPSEISRKDEIFISKSGLISIAGGKLTGYRLMAKKTVNKLLRKKSNEYQFVKCQTKNIPLSGGDFSFHKDIEETCLQNFQDYKELGISYENFKLLFYRYGKNTNLILQKALEYKNNSNNPFLKAELWYNINYEMLSNLSDYFILRTDILYFHIELIQSLLDPVTHEMASLLNWSNAEKKLQKELFLSIYKSRTNFK